MNKSIRWWNWYARRYAKRPVADQQTYERKLALTQKYLSPESRVLEFGCGTGSTALHHAPKVARLLAVDSARAMIEIANEKKAAAGQDNVEFRCATLFDLDSTATYDAVLGLNVLHLIDGWEASIQRAHDLLEPGGVFVTSTVCVIGRLERLLLPLGGRLGLIPMVERISVEELERAHAACGFRIVERFGPTKEHPAAFLIAKK